MLLMSSQSQPNQHHKDKMKGNNHSRIIHCTVTNSLDKGPTGKIMSRHLKDIYCVLLINLKLQEKSSIPPPTASKMNNFFSLRKLNYPYSFYLQDAIEKMRILRIEIPRSGFQKSYSYSIKDDLALELMHCFFEAKFLHYPGDRTRKLPKYDIPLQPTPKGVAILHQFVKKNGLNKALFPQILRSNFNSMDLFNLEKSIKTDKIYLSDSFVELLFIKCMGARPNVWSTNNAVDAIPRSIIENLENSDPENEETSIFNFDKFSFEDLIVYDEKEPLLNHNSHQPQDEDLVGSSESRKLFKLSNRPRSHLAPQSSDSESSTISPFTHKFFTNPESDAHTQYYVSNKGVRLFKDKKIGDAVQSIDYCFSGKALCQWIMDCCDVLYIQEACLLGQFFMKLKLIEPLNSLTQYPDRFKIGRSYLYKLTSNGREKCHWDKSNEEIVRNIKRIGAETRRGSMTSINMEYMQSNESVNDDDDDDSCSSVEKLNQMIINKIPQKKIILRDVLNDAGLRYLFRCHLENEYCVENYDAYHLLQAFRRDMKVLRKKLHKNKSMLQNKQYLLHTIPSNIDIDQHQQRAMKKSIRGCIKHANDCLANAYNIFGSYLVSGAINEVNINYNVKTQITNVMTHPKSPVSTAFFTPASTKFLLQGLETDSMVSVEISSNVEDDMVLSNVKSLSNGENDSGAMILGASIEDNDSLSDDQSTVLASPTLINHNILSTTDVPNEEIFSSSLFVLNRIYLLFDKVAKDLYVLMENDSLQKFIESDIYKQSSEKMKVFQVRGH
ncbi:GTPase-activating protein [Saccharomycopsis crataegensis]|uniref:GTPase-activating protein n=1 Tax=Saccharomycopsis crataegensis TaxID=43959 RepID=A0AAV5QJ37_9ASCO|nr:GTPase-activating protein [Saccharomycopsis crataegensis]